MFVHVLIFFINIFAHVYFRFFINVISFLFLLNSQKVAAGVAREYGMAMVSKIHANNDAGAALLGDLPNETKVWMSHGDKLHSVPEV